MKWSAALWASLAVLPLLALLAKSFERDPKALPSTRLNKAAPMFVLPDLNQEAQDAAPIDLSKLLGKPVVINFWSTWCGPCKAEHALLQDAARFYGDKVQFLGIVYQDSAEAARSYLASRTNIFPQLIDTQSDVAIRYGVGGVPETFFIDAQGQVAYKHTSVLQAPILARFVDAALAQNPKAANLGGQP